MKGPGLSGYETIHLGTIPVLHKVIFQESFPIVIYFAHIGEFNFRRSKWNIC